MLMGSAGSPNVPDKRSPVSLVLHVLGRLAGSLTRVALGLTGLDALFLSR